MEEPRFAVSRTRAPPVMTKPEPGMASVTSVWFWRGVFGKKGVKRGIREDKAADVLIVQAGPTPILLIRGRTVALPAAEQKYWMKYLPAMTSVLLPGMTSARAVSFVSILV